MIKRDWWSPKFIMLINKVLLTFNPHLKLKKWRKPQCSFKWWKHHKLYFCKSSHGCRWRGADCIINSILRSSHEPLLCSLTSELELCLGRDLCQLLLQHTIIWLELLQMLLFVWNSCLYKRPIEISADLLKRIKHTLDLSCCRIESLLSICLTQLFLLLFSDTL